MLLLNRTRGEGLELTLPCTVGLGLSAGHPSYRETSPVSSPGPSTPCPPLPLSTGGLVRDTIREGRRRIRSPVVLSTYDNSDNMGNVSTPLTPGLSGPAHESQCVDQPAVSTLHLGTTWFTPQTQMTSLGMDPTVRSRVGTPSLASEEYKGPPEPRH